MISPLLATVTQASPPRAKVDEATADSSIITLGYKPVVGDRIAVVRFGRTKLLCIAHPILLDGLGASDFLRKGGSGNGENTARVPSKTTLGLNQRLRSGWYDEDGIVGAPDGGWWLIQVISHSNGAHWQRQIAYSMTGQGGTQNVYSRRCNGGDPTVASSWSPWQLIAGGDNGWTNLPYLNGWSTYGASWHPAQARKLSGIVYVRGLVRPGTLGADICQFPVGMRPAPGGTNLDQNANLHIRGLGCEGGETGYLFRGNGLLGHWNVGNAPGSWFDLAGVRPFPAEQ